MSETHVPPAAPAPAPAPAPPPPPAPSPAPPAAHTTFRDPPAPRGERSVEALERELADTRAEAAARRVESRNNAEALDRERARAEQIQRDADARVAAAQETERQRTETFRRRTIDAELRAAAAAEGIQDLDLLPLITREGIAVDDDGNVTGATEAVQRFSAAKPAYFRQPEPAPQPGQRQPAATGPRPSAAPAPSSAAPAVADVRALPDAEYRAARLAAVRGLRGQR